MGVRTAWFNATCSALLAAPAEPRMQSSRVDCTISMIVFTPLPGSPASAHYEQRLCIRQPKSSMVMKWYNLSTVCAAEFMG
jgi:hypothetical protein